MINFLHQNSLEVIVYWEQMDECSQWQKFSILITFQGQKSGLIFIY